MLEADQLAFIIFGSKRKCRRYEIPFPDENESKTKMDIHFRPKNENVSKSPDNISVFFFIHSVTKSALQIQCAANTSSSFAFLQVVLVDGIPFSSCTVYRHLRGIFVDDISTREQFAFLVYCYRVKAIFHNFMHCALLASVYPNSPIC